MITEQFKNNNQKNIWYLKYGPSSVDQCILPPRIKDKIVEKVGTSDVPPLMFIGPPGCGKTSTARAIVTQLGGDLLFLRTSKGNGVDMLRTKVQDFASTMSLENKPKFVIFDEADRLTVQAQDDLRGFIDEYAEVCTFIFTANYINRISEALRSRCNTVIFDISKAEIIPLMKEFFQVCKRIMENEGINYKDDQLKTLVARYAPDWRKMLNRLQFNVCNGALVDDDDSSETAFNELFKFIKVKDFKGIRTWVAEHATTDSADVFNALFNNSTKLFTNTSQEIAVTTIAKYYYYATMAVDQQINTTACIAELIATCDIIR